MPSTPAPSPWWVVVPVKGTPQAKSRLAVPSGASRAEVAHAIALDTLQAVCRALPPEQVLVVTASPEVASAATGFGARTLLDDGHGLRGAIALGLDAVPSGAAVAILLGDLPALRPTDLTQALGAAAAHERAFVPDRTGTGTTLATAGPGIRHTPLFGSGSAAAHERAGYHRLTGMPGGLRTDVDDAADLAVAATLGLGPRTAALVGG